MGSCLSKKYKQTEPLWVFKESAALHKGSAEIHPDLQRSIPESVKYEEY